MAGDVRPLSSRGSSLDDGLSTAHLELHPLGARSTAGPFTLFRLAQTYRGLPLSFELDGRAQDWMPFRHGESCWVDRGSTAGVMPVDYCEGEEPPPSP